MMIKRNLSVKAIVRSITNEAKQRDKISAIPHPVSKLRLFSFAAEEKETDYERRLRKRRIQIQHFNHEYWSQINTEFNQVIY